MESLMACGRRLTIRQGKEHNAPLLTGIQVPYGGRREFGHIQEEASTCKLPPSD